MFQNKIEKETNYEKVSHEKTERRFFWPFSDDKTTEADASTSILPTSSTKELMSASQKHDATMVASSAVNFHIFQIFIL